ncbi:MAG: transposase [Gemmatimonadetes bacterium]|nr:transposase [Gemmatimonadota bacterium]
MSNATSCAPPRATTPRPSTACYPLRTVHGIGKVLSLILFYQIDDIRRFPSLQDFVSWADR